MPDHMPDTPQIYLITPGVFELAVFSDQLAAILDAHQIACVRLALHTSDDHTIRTSADHLRALCHTRDVAAIIADHTQLVVDHGLDGVHLSGDFRQIRNIRKTLGQDAIIGAFCGTSKHAGLTAGEIGADYVAFGPVGETPLGNGISAPLPLFEWWSTMVELPVVAEGALTPAQIIAFASVTDFFALGDEIWSTENPQSTLATYLKSIQS